MRTEHSGQSLNSFCGCPPPLSNGINSHTNFQDSLYTQTHVERLSEVKNTTPWS